MKKRLTSASPIRGAIGMKEDANKYLRVLDQQSPYKSFRSSAQKKSSQGGSSSDGFILRP
jgi:hypothetical protein